MTRVSTYCLCWVMLGFVRATKINLVFVTSENPRFGLITSGPAFDVAIENMKRKFPEVLTQRNQIQRYEIYEAGIFSCDEAGVEMQFVAGQMTNLIQQLDGFVVLLCSGCSAEIMVLGDFAREWNVPLLGSSASDGRLANKRRYPTVSAYGPVDIGSFASAARLFLDAFSYRISTLCLDELSQYPRLSTVYLLLYRAFKQNLEQPLGKYFINIIKYDSRNTTDYRPMLNQLRYQSRIIFIFTRPSLLRDILITAHALNMTNGEYLFIAPESTKQPTLGKLNWKNNDTDDEAAFTAFQSAIIMTHPSPNLETSASIFDEVALTSKTRYNKTLTEDEMANDLVIGAYQAIETLAITLNRSTVSLEQLNGQSFSYLLWNKTYDLDMMPIYVDEYGMKKGDVQFSRLNESSGHFHEAWRYFAFTRSFSRTYRLASRWYRRTDAPPDSPPCGFRGEYCAESRSVLTLSLVILCPIVVLLLAAGATTLKWYLNRRKEHFSLWWCMDGKIFDPDSDNVKFVATGTPTSDDVVRQDILTKCQYKLRMYNGSAVWTEAIVPTVTFDAIRRNKQMLRCLASIKHLHNENVGRFHGIVTSSSYTYLVWEFGVHASLRMLLDTNSHNATNSDLLVSMIWDILQGMDYIHSQELHHHGVCSSLTCMIDKRFCLQICGYGSARMLSLMANRNVESTEDVMQLWMAPEMLVDRRHPGSKAADVFSVALVILEIFTRNTPMDVILESESSCRHAIENLLILRGTRIPIAYEVPRMLHEILQDSLSVNTRERPHLRHLMQKMENPFPKKGFLDKILSRLQKYSEELEMKVAVQSQELFDEQSKVDALLKQMIPAEFVNKLRNKEPVLTESFDCVTLMFSDMPEFSGIVTKSSPLQLIILLNSVYSTIDVLIESFDVYKVETIKDSYMVVSGLPHRNGDQHVIEISQMALRLLETRLISPVDNVPLHLRIGIHSGPCAAGIVGIRSPRYCLFGDTINVASRMETNGAASQIHISPSVKELLNNFGGYVLQSRGKIPIKGKGDMETFWLLGRHPV